MTSASPTRRSLLTGGAALGLVALLPPPAWADQMPAPWRPGSVWIVGTGGLGIHLDAAFRAIEGVEPRVIASMDDCTFAANDILLLAIPPPEGPDRISAWTRRHVERVNAVKRGGGVPFLLTLLGSEEQQGVSDATGATLIALDRMSQSVDAAQVEASPLELARGIVRRVGLTLPLRDRNVGCLRTPLGLMSASCGRPMRAVAYVPDADGPLPVLYLLHGAWGAFSDWSLAAHDALCAAAIAHRVILVCPEGLPFGWYLDSPRVPENQIRTHLIDELIPYVQANLPASEVRSIGGLSMGGHGALLLSLTHPGTFQAASSMSGAVDICHVPKSKQITRLLGAYADHEAAWVAHSAARQLIERAEVAAKLPMRLTCGTDDIWFQTNLEVHEGLEKRGIAHVWEAAPGAGHTWDYWIAQLPLHVAWHASILHGT